MEVHTPGPTPTWPEETPDLPISLNSGIYLRVLKGLLKEI